MARMYIDVLIRRGEWSDAHEQAQRIGASPNNEALGHYLQARVYQAQQRFEDAVKEYRATIEAQPRALEALSGLVASYQALNQGSQALDYLNDYIKRVPDSFHAQTLIGQVQARQKNWDLAKAAFEQAISLNNSWVPAYRDLATVYLQAGDTDGAIKVCERGLQAVPDNSELKLMQATAYERLDRYDDAIAVYDSVLKKDNSVTIAANNLAALIADHDREPAQLQHALEVARRFEASDNPLFLDTVGWVYYRLGNFEQAVALLERAASGASQVAQVRYHLGMAYYATSQRDLAKRELQAAVDGKDQDFVGRDEAQATLAQL